MLSGRFVSSRCDRIDGRSTRKPACRSHVGEHRGIQEGINPEEGGEAKSDRGGFVGNGATQTGVGRGEGGSFGNFEDVGASEVGAEQRSSSNKRG